MVLRSLRSVHARAPGARVVAAGLLFASLGMSAGNAAAADVLRAEYSLRWTSGAGGPADPEKVLKVLGLKKGKKEKYGAQYFDTDPAVGTLPGFSVVLRERVGDKTDVTWKYRGAAAPPQADRDTWACPLLQVDKRKDEQDISVGSDGSVRQAFSRSCTAEQRFDKAVPAALKVTRRGCKGDVTVLESKDKSVGVELWTLKPGLVYLEVSSKGEGSAAALEAFRSKVVARLLASGVKPLDRGMTDLASQC